MMDEYLEIDLEQLRIREIEEIEEIVGCGFDEAFKDGKPRGRALRALGYVVKRRTNPDFTLEQAGELILKLGEPDPTTAAG